MNILFELLFIIVIELAVERVFETETTSVIEFLRLILPHCKVFKDEVTKIFELMLKVIELHPEFVKKYTKSIVKVGRGTSKFVVLIEYCNEIDSFPDMFGIYTMQ